MPDEAELRKAIATCGEFRFSLLLNDRDALDVTIAAARTLLSPEMVAMMEAAKKLWEADSPNDIAFAQAVFNAAGLSLGRSLTASAKP